MEGTLELELVPLGTLVERIRAGGAGIGGFLTQVGVGTVVEQGKEKKIINGKEYILELPLTADFGLIRALKADRMGNLLYHGVARSFNNAMAAASKVTIVEAEEIVGTGELDPEVIHTPAIYVQRIVKIAKEEILWRRQKSV
jgi:3-oxoacid CoA-transferase A subunit